MKATKLKKPTKVKKRKKPPTLPEFVPTIHDAEFLKNLRLAKYGRKIGQRGDALDLFESIADWRKRLPRLLTTPGYTAAQIKESATNATKRVEWCERVEEAIERGDAEFFDTIAAAIRHEKQSSAHAHHIEFHTWNEAFRLLRATLRPAPNGKGFIEDWPTKGELKRAVEAKGVKVSKEQFSRVLRRLHLYQIPVNKSGPKKKTDSVTHRGLRRQ